MQRWQYFPVMVRYYGGAGSNVPEMRKLVVVDGSTIIAVNTPLRDALHTLGDLGWELIGIQPLDDHRGVYTFRRPLPAQEAGSLPHATT